MRGRPGCRCCCARADGLSPLEPPRPVQRLPSRGASAWCCARLLPWQVQFPAGVCGALRTGRRSGVGAVVCPPPPNVAPPSCTSRFLSRGVPSGYPIACCLCVTVLDWLPFWYAPRVGCVLVRSRSCGARPPPPVLLCAHFARSPRRALVGPLHGVHAPPRFLPASLALFVLRGRGGGGLVHPFPSPFGVYLSV